MAVELVTNPASGKPAVAETVYRDIELAAEREKLAAIEAQLEVAVPAADEANKRVAALESQLEDQKSLVSQAEALTPDAESDGAQAGDGSEVSTDGEAEPAVESADESGGDTGAAETVAVEVTVTPAVEDEY